MYFKQFNREKDIDVFLFFTFCAASQIKCLRNLKEILKEHVNTDWSINSKTQIQNLLLLEPIFTQNDTIF